MGRPSTSWTLGRVVVVVAMLGLALFWIAVFAGLFDRKNADYLHDRAFVSRTARTCKATMATVARLPPARESRTAAQRADVVDRATSELARMIDRIGSDRPSDPQEARVMRMWLADWRVYLTDRRDYTRRLRRNAEAQFLVDRKPKANDSYDTVIKNFADINNIPVCDPPLDVG